jgi:amidophosphoribosyltransferase
MESVHPVMRVNNWRSRNLALAGNFNLTNVDELFGILREIGQHPKNFSDTVTVLEKIGFYLDEAHQELYHRFKSQKVPNHEISPLIEEQLDIASVLANASKRYDGGYVMAGILGHGDAFVARDPWGIRPAFYYHDDEVAIVTSERPVIQTVMNVDINGISEIPPGSAFIVKRSGEIQVEQVREPGEKRSCSFERIYFSRGSDADIYRERKMLGNLLVPDILASVENDLDHTVFSYIPNTAESAFYGMVKGIEQHLMGIQKKRIEQMGSEPDPKELKRILDMRPRVEKIAIKDVKLRTFIAADKGRDDLVGHVYDVTYGTVTAGKDNLVVIDDSIVRGTTLKKSILKILDRLNPRKIIIVSSSPQIRYPDCYGIDMAKLSDFIAFQAAIKLLKEKNLESLINEVYNDAKAQLELPAEKMINPVKKIYEPLKYREVSDKIARMLKTSDIQADVEIVYQKIENLHKACPGHLGDWYFTGNYPTPGGNKVVSKSFINYIEGRDQRAY